MLRMEWAIPTEEIYYHKLLFTHLPILYGTLILVAWVSFVYALSWEKFNLSRVESNLIKVLTACISWCYLFYDYNFYFDQWHAFDRLLLSLLCLLTLRYPLFLIPVLMQINVMHHQFDFPLGGFNFLDKTMPYEMLAISSSYLLLVSTQHFIRRLFFPDLSVYSKPILTYLLLFTSAACYFHSGLEKVIISPHGWEWAFYNPIENNLMAMFHRGWLALYPQWNTAIFSCLAYVKVPVQLLILLGELAFIGIFFSKRLSKGLFVLMLFLHISVLITNGAFFWLWMIADIGILWLIIKSDILFNWKTGLIGMICILLAFVIIRVPKLGWFDAPLDNRFELSGNDHIHLSEATLSPYTRHFQHGDFLSLINAKTLYPGFLVFDLATLKELEKISPDAVTSLLETKGNNRYKPEFIGEMRIFLHRFMKNGRANPVHFLQPPNYWNAHLFSTGMVIENKALESITLLHVTELNKGQTSWLLKRTPILRVENEMLSTDSTLHLK